MFEPVHGSADLGEHAAATAVENAISAVLEHNGPDTPDIGGKARTTELGGSHSDASFGMMSPDPSADAGCATSNRF